MKVVLTTFLMIFSLGFAQAADLAVEGGIRQQSGDPSAGLSATSENGVQAGLTAAFPISGSFYLRSGFLYTQRPQTISVTGAPTSSAKFTANYFDIPVTAMLKFEEYVGVYAGMVLAMKLNTSITCEGALAGASCQVTNANSMLTPFVLGASFKFAPQMGADVYYEMGGDIADGFKSQRAVGVNFMFTFD